MNEETPMAAGDDAPLTAPAASAAPATAPQKAARPAVQVLERLFELYPKMFGARFLPLKLGVFHDLMERHAGEFGKDELKAALGFHTRSTRYLESVAQGHQRHDLDANPVEDVAPEHVWHAILEIARRRSGRGKDPSPWVRERIVAAVDASGLDREAYEARVQPKDDVALAALDDAFSALGERAARSEALRRAYESSGKSIEEFAQMYGMKPSQVRVLLGTDAPADAAQPG